MEFTIVRTGHTGHVYIYKSIDKIIVIVERYIIFIIC